MCGYVDRLLCSQFNVYPNDLKVYVIFTTLCNIKCHKILNYGLQIQSLKLQILLFLRNKTHLLDLSCPHDSYVKQPDPSGYIPAVMVAVGKLSNCGLCSYNNFLFA